LDAEARPQDVAEHVDGLRQVLRQDGGVEDGILLAGEGVGTGADAVKVAVDRKGVASLAALEDHVLEEVRHAGDFRRLVARPGADPEPQRHRPRRRDCLTDDRQSVRQNLAMKLHYYISAIPCLAASQRRARAPALATGSRLNGR